MRRRIAMLRLLTFALVASASACEPTPSEVPQNLTIGAAPLAAWNAPAIVAAPQAAPHIVAMRFTSLDVARGEDWSGEIVTPSNVASVEVRTNLFTIDVPRTTVGKFAFHLHVLALPPIFLRPYTLRIIARNAAGDEDEEDVAFRFR